MSRARLTDKEKEAVLDVLHERLAGGTEDLRDAMGISEKEADAMMVRLNNVVRKLTCARVASLPPRAS